MPRMPSLANVANVIDLMAISRAGVAPPTYPATNAQALSLLGFEFDELYLCQEASGNATSEFAADLTVAGTPVFRRAMPDGRLGIYYDSSLDEHIADVWTLGSSSVLLMAVVEFVADPGVGQAGIIGRLNVAGASDGVDISVYATTGFLNMLVRDTASASVSVNGATDVRALGGLWLAQVQVDRSGTPTARARFSRWGGGIAAQTLSASIAAHGALDGVLGMDAGLAGYGARVHGNAIGWAAVKIGATIEGSGVLAANAVAMGFEA